LVASRPSVASRQHHPFNDLHKLIRDTAKAKAIAAGARQRLPRKARRSLAPSEGKGHTFESCRARHLRKGKGKKGISGRAYKTANASSRRF
jgi:hypothetical protein